MRLSTRRGFLALSGLNLLALASSGRALAGARPETLSLEGYRQTFRGDLDRLPSPQWKRDNLSAGEKSQWTPRYRFTHDPKGCSFHGEHQWYVDPSYDWGDGIGHVSQITSKDGIATITARRTPTELLAKMPFRLDQNKQQTTEPYPFISGVLTTQFSFWFKYGYVEADLKLPAGRALWPAFWLLPKEWPYSPEIDIMEFIGHEPRKSHYNVIAGEPGKPLPGVGIYADRGQDLTRDWHTFGCLWLPDSLEFFIDRKSIGKVPAHPTIDKCHYYLILNLAVGGKWPGPPGADTPDEAHFRVRSVGVWQKQTG